MRHQYIVIQTFVLWEIFWLGEKNRITINIITIINPGEFIVRTWVTIVRKKGRPGEPVLLLIS